MYKIFSHFIIIIALLSSSVISASSVAVIDYGSSGISKKWVASILDTLRVELGRTGKYDVMERVQMESIFSDQGYTLGNTCNNDTCAREIGKVLAVKNIVLTNISGAGKAYKTYTLSFWVIEVENGKIITKIVEIHKGYVEKYLLKKIPKIAQKLAGTYKKKEISGFARAMLTIGAIAVAFPIVRYLTPDETVSEDDEPTTGVKIIWSD